MNMRDTAKQPQPTAPLPLKKVIPAVLLSSMALPMTAPAQPSPTPASSEDQAWEELFEQPSAAEPEGQTAETEGRPANQEPGGLTGTTDKDQVTSQAESVDQSDRPEDAELDLIPVASLPPDKATPVKEPANFRQLEEIVVTAQKREQVSQDVPISMTVLSDVFIKEQGITTVQDALLFVPNFKVTEFGGRVTPQCRGFVVSDQNPAFEAPCGLALDGVSFSRGSYFSAGLLDLKRIEVLRGPQGTTFGKNTTAGVVALYSKDPTDEFVANIDLQHGLSGPGPRRAEIGVGGPLVPGVVNFRVVGARELRDPYMENTYHETDPSVPKDVGDSERNAYRIKLTFPDLLGAELKLLHEKTDAFSNGYPIKYVPLTQTGQDYVRQYDPNADFEQNYKVSNFGNQVWTETTRTQAELNFDWADWGFTGVVGFGNLNTYQDFRNIFPTPFPFAASRRGEDSPFITGELRAVSPEFDGLLGLDSLFGMDLGSSSLLVGVFGQENRIKNLQLDADFYYEGLAILLASGVSLPTSMPVGPGTVLALLDQQGGVRPYESFFIRFRQEVLSQALFSQLTWNMTPKWSLDLGARISQESKDGHWNVYYSQPAPAFDPAGDRAYMADKSLDTFNFQPKISLTYRLSDDINLFAHWAVSYKSGGFNAYTSTGNPEERRTTNTNQNATVGSLTFEDEVGEDWGFDIKSRFLDNTVQINLSLFRLTVTDFQVLTEVLGTKIPGSDATGGAPVYLPDGYQQVFNAGEARAQGAELDLTWLATDWLTVIAAVGYNDTEFLSFPLDSCGSFEEPDEETGRCDHTGLPFKGTPKLAGTLSLDTRFPLGGLWSRLGDTNLLLGGTAEYTGPKYEGDYFQQSDAQYRYRAHIGLANGTQGWSFRITGLNLTDEYVGGGGKPDHSGTSLVTQVAPPRSFFAQFSWNY